MAPESGDAYENGNNREQVTNGEEINRIKSTAVLHSPTVKTARVLGYSPPMTPKVTFSVSLGLFGLAGIGVTGTSNPGWTLLASLVAIIGVLVLAPSLQQRTRREHARLSLLLWIAFLIIASFHLVRTETILTAVPVESTYAFGVFIGSTWATFLGALTSTTLLAFREFGSSPGRKTDLSEDRVLDRKSDY